MAFIFGGCPAILWLVGVFLYFGVGDLYRYTPPNAEPEIAAPRLTNYLVLFYMMLVVDFILRWTSFGESPTNIDALLMPERSFSLNTIAFMSANYVARQLDYHMPKGWGQGDAASQAHFRPLDTFGERFETILSDIKNMGFDYMDLWGGILSPTWASAEHIAIARNLLNDYGLTVLSFANGIPDLAYMEAACKLCAALDIPLIGGGGPAIQDDRAGVVKLLQEYGVQLGFENHPEPSAEVILSIIGDDHADLIGVALDTGWIGTQGADILETTRKLLPRIKYVHVKDVLAVGDHDTCKFGDGIVDLEGCIKFLEANGYTGGYSVEHEPHDYDPTEEILESAAMLREWVGQGHD